MKITKFSSQYDRQGEVIDLPWERIAKRLATHTVGAKDGTAISCGLFAGTRSTDNLTARTAIALDVETSKTTGEIAPDPRRVAEALRDKRLAGVVWTTFSHDPGEPRYRVLVPLAQEIVLDEVNFIFDHWFVPAVAMALDLGGVCDRTKFGAASLFYLPRYSPDREHLVWAQVVEGNPLRAAAALEAAHRLHDSDMRTQREELASAYTMDPKVVALIQGFNAANPVEDLLDRYGYRRRGRRWKSPHQSASSVGATEIRSDDMGQRWLSFSESDAAAGVGRRPRKSSQVMCYGDAFSLMRSFEARNDFRTALERARERP